MAIKKRRSKKLIVANWKMHPLTHNEAVREFEAIRKVGAKATHVQTVVCASYLHIEAMTKKLTGHRVAVGGQDCYYEKAGSFTGEVSPSQLVNSGAEYVILGHSERRELGESSELISKKVAAALSAGLRVILCVGESKRDGAGAFIDILKKQIKESLDNVPRKYFLNLIVCYEPVWAISSHARAGFKGESPDDMLEMAIFVRKTLTGITGRDLALKVAVLYGGSVDSKNAESFLAEGGVDGLLVGHASLTPQSFNEIIKIADKIA